MVSNLKVVYTFEISYFLDKLIMLADPIRRQFVRFNSLSLVLQLPSAKNFMPESLILKKNISISIRKIKAFESSLITWCNQPNLGPTAFSKWIWLLNLNHWFFRSQSKKCNEARYTLWWWPSLRCRLDFDCWLF